MKSQLVFVTSVFLVIPPAIWADIKDFIIENENDLQRFGLADSDADADTEQNYDDDLDSEWMRDSCGGGGNANPYTDYVGNEEAIDYDSSQIDPRLLREIVRQMKSDPRFEHLWEHLTEENIVMDRKMSEYDADGDALDLYVDMNENFQGGDNYEIE